VTPEFETASISLAREQLARGVSVQLTARGGSMWPFLLPGDVLTLTPGGRARLGDVVLVEMPGVEFGVLHRVVSILPGRVLTKGDALPRVDGWARRERVIARVTRVRRAGTSFTPMRWLPLPVSLVAGLWPRG
jgi:hypothetical protein